MQPKKEVLYLKKLAMVSALAIILTAFTLPSQATQVSPTVITWDTPPVAGELSPAFTLSVTVDRSVSRSEYRNGGLQVYLMSSTGAAAPVLWNLGPLGDNCRNGTAKACPIDSIKIRPFRGGSLGALEDVPLSTLRSWPPNGSPTPNQGFVIDHRDYITPSWVGFVLGDEIQIRFAAGAFEVPEGTDINLARVYFTEYVAQAFSGGSIGDNGFITLNGVNYVEATPFEISLFPPSQNSPANPVMAAIDVNPTNITVDNEIITITGANLNTVTDVYIGGIRVPIFTQSGNRLQVRAPKGLSGLVDLELKSSLNDVLMTKKLNFGGVAATGTRKTTLIVGGFAPNSRKLTARMQARIERWLDRNSDLSTLTCTGFTSLPRRTTDVTLSTNRGKTACNFSKRQRSELETSVSQGIEDSRPGSNVRRVRLVLTP